MSAQREFFSRGRILKIARQTWIDRTKEETIVKVILDGLTACRIPVFRVRERISTCPRCHQFVGQPSQAGIPDIVGYIPVTEAAKKSTADHNEHLAIYGAEPMRDFAKPLFIEVKKPTGGIESEAQKEFIKRAQDAGAIAFFARGWDECADNLRAAGVRLPEGL